MEYRLLSTSLEKRELKGKFPYLYEYILYGEKKHLNQASTLASRAIWYDQGVRKLPDLSFSYMINDIGRTFLMRGFTNNNFHNIYAKKNSRTIWLYLNSTIGWLIQQLLMRSNLGEGAGKIETYELADFPTPDINLENLKIDLGETKNFKEELGTLENLKTVNSERIKLDNAVLEAIGYKNKKERDVILLELYRSTYQLINARLQKAQSMKGVKAQRNKVAFSVYVEQLKSMLIEEKYSAKDTYKFAKELEKLVKDISSNDKLQKKILNTYWKEKFGHFFDVKEIANNDQGKLF